MKYKFLILSCFLVLGALHVSNGQSLVGKWQLIHFEGIEKIRNSAQYREADLEVKSAMESRITERLENTVYQFSLPDSLLFTEFVSQVVVQQKARFEVDQNQILIITLPNQVKKAKIITLEEMELVLEPLVEANAVGKWIFERIIDHKKD